MDRINEFAFKIATANGTGSASANGLIPCTDAQFGKGTNNPIACPAASKIGTVEVQTPSLPADSLTGTVYVGQPKSNDPSTGEQFRIVAVLRSLAKQANERSRRLSDVGLEIGVVLVRERQPRIE